MTKTIILKRRAGLKRASRMVKALLHSLVALFAAVTAQVSANERQLPEYQDWQQQYFSGMPFVQDAIRRWEAKEGNRSMAGRHIEIMRFPTKVCVQFSFTGPAVGGVPVYCYEVGSDRSAAKFELIEEYSDVE